MNSSTVSDVSMTTRFELPIPLLHKRTLSNISDSSCDDWPIRPLESPIYQDSQQRITDENPLTPTVNGLVATQAPTTPRSGSRADKNMSSPKNQGRTRMSIMQALRARPDLVPRSRSTEPEAAQQTTEATQPQLCAAPVDEDGPRSRTPLKAPRSPACREAASSPDRDARLINLATRLALSPSRLRPSTSQSSDRAANDANDQYRIIWHNSQTADAAQDGCGPRSSSALRSRSISQPQTPTNHVSASVHSVWKHSPQ